MTAITFVCLYVHVRANEQNRMLIKQKVTWINLKEFSRKSECLNAYGSYPSCKPAGSPAIIYNYGLYWYRKDFLFLKLCLY